MAATAAILYANSIARASWLAGFPESCLATSVVQISIALYFITVPGITFSFFLHPYFFPPIN